MKEILLYMGIIFSMATLGNLVSKMIMVGYSDRYVMKMQIDLLEREYAKCKEGFE